jgi:hypothetical protein
VKSGYGKSNYMFASNVKLLMLHFVLPLPQPFAF